jgi:hypothetical protein
LVRFKKKRIVRFKKNGLFVLRKTVCSLLKKRFGRFEKSGFADGRLRVTRSYASTRIGGSPM